MNKPRFLQSSAYATDLLIGVTDGIMLPMALAAALSTLIPNPATVLLICGLYAVFLALLMGTASYFTIVNQAEENVDMIPEMERNNPNRFAKHLQLKEILVKLELGKEALQRADYENMQYHKHWTQLLQDFGIGSSLPDFERARKSGGMVGLSFILGGLLPIIPYIFVNNSEQGLKFALLLSLVGLALVGVFKAAYTGIKAWQESLRLVLTCLITTGATFLVFYLLSK